MDTIRFTISLYYKNVTQHITIVILRMTFTIFSKIECYNRMLEVKQLMYT